MKYSIFALIIGVSMGAIAAFGAPCKNSKCGNAVNCVPNTSAGAGMNCEEHDSAASCNVQYVVVSEPAGNPNDTIKVCETGPNTKECTNDAGDVVRCENAKRYYCVWQEGSCIGTVSNENPDAKDCKES